MIIQNVCLSIKNCVMMHYILYSYFVFIIFKLYSMKYNLDIFLNLTMDTLTSIFLSVNHFKFADLYYQSFLCEHWNVLY